jgi:hypothetical protein
MSDEQSPDRPSSSHRQTWQPYETTSSSQAHSSPLVAEGTEIDKRDMKRYTVRGGIRIGSMWIHSQALPLRLTLDHQIKTVIISLDQYYLIGV